MARRAGLAAPHPQLTQNTKRFAAHQPQRLVPDRILMEHPRITEGNVHVAAVAADTAALQGILDADPAAARREGGPYRWEPLFCLAYARHDPAISASGVIGAARLLLEAGADPNVGYLWHGLPTPFTVLTGVFGEGELGPVRQPRHPHSLALARLLLEAGADPNDGQALYNRMFEPGNDHLELLLEFGLGTGDGGPWHRRLGAALDTPAEMVRGELAWAITHGMTERVRLLVSHDQPWQTALHKAAEDGNLELARTLLGLGADPDIRDTRFNSTPLGWARYFAQEELIELLEPLTSTPETAEGNDHEG